MGTFSTPVRDYMSSPALCVDKGARLIDAYACMQRHDVSGLAVVDEGTTLAGVLSLADLVRFAQLDSLRGGRAHLARIPDEIVERVMSHGPLTVAPTQSVAQAARIMHNNRVHRVFVLDEGKLVGALSTHDLMRAVRDHGDATPIGELATRGVVRVDATDPVSLALERMQASHVHGLVVTDQAWPVGVFTQADALAARNAAPSTPVADCMNPSVLVLPEELALHRAAAQASALRARRIVVTNGAAPSGILSGLDFARAVR